jgi:hypothetical protein
MASSLAFLLLDLSMNIKILTEYSQFLQEMELVWGINYTGEQNSQSACSICSSLSIVNEVQTLTVVTDPAQNESMSILE